MPEKKIYLPSSCQCSFGFEFHWNIRNLASAVFTLLDVWILSSTFFKCQEVDYVLN